MPGRFDACLARLRRERTGLGTQRARSATTASSTIMPDGVARSRELPTGATSPSSCSIDSRAAGSGLPARALVAGEVDALGQPQPHQQELVGLLRARQDLAAGDAVAPGLDEVGPGLRHSFGDRHDAPAVFDEAAMRAGADADIFAIAPIGQIVAAFGARAARGWKSRRPAAHARRSSPASPRKARRPGRCPEWRTSVPRASAWNGVPSSIVSW